MAQFRGFRIPLFVHFLVSVSLLRLQVTAQDTQHSTIDKRDTEISVEYTKDSEFQDAVLNVTNTYREQHNASSLKWNETLEDIAQGWSDRCVFEHSGGPTGENLASGYPNASASIIAWGDERDIYDFKKGEFSKKTGHFTQLVWKTTTSVGCARTRCDGKDDGGAPGWYVVCEYWPHGNVIGRFAENVQARLKEGEQGPADHGPGDQDGDDDGDDEEGEGGDGDGDKGDGENGRKECPLGGVCSGAESAYTRKGDAGAWVVICVAIVVCAVGLL